MFVDYLAINPDFFSLNLEFTLGIIKNCNNKFFKKI